MPSRLALRSIPLNRIQGNARSIVMVEIFGAPAPSGGDPVLITFSGGRSVVTDNGLIAPITCSLSTVRSLSYSSTIDSQYNLSIVGVKYGNVAIPIVIPTALSLSSGKSKSNTTTILSEYRLPSVTISNTHNNNALLTTSFIKGGLTTVNKSNVSTISAAPKFSLISTTNYSDLAALTTTLRLNTAFTSAKNGSIALKALLMVPIALNRSSSADYALSTDSYTGFNSSSNKTNTTMLLTTTAISFNGIKQAAINAEIKGEFKLGYAANKSTTTTFALRSDVKVALALNGDHNFTLEDLIVDFIGTKLNFVSSANIVDTSGLWTTTTLGSINNKGINNAFTLRATNSVNFTNAKAISTTNAFHLPISVPINTQSVKVNVASIASSARMNYQSAYAKTTYSYTASSIRVQHATVLVKVNTVNVLSNSYVRLVSARARDTNSIFTVPDLLSFNNNYHSETSVTIKCDATLNVNTARNKGMQFALFSTAALNYNNAVINTSINALSGLPVITFVSAKTNADSVSIRSSYAVSANSGINANLFVLDLNDEGVGTRITFESNTHIESVLSYIVGEYRTKYQPITQRNITFALKSEASTDFNVGITKTLNVNPKTITVLAVSSYRSKRVDIYGLKIDTEIDYHPVTIKNFNVNGPYIDSFISANLIKVRTMNAGIKGESYLSSSFNTSKGITVQPRTINELDLHSLVGWYNDVGIASDYQINLNLLNEKTADSYISSYAGLSINGAYEVNSAMEIRSDVKLVARTTVNNTQPVKLGSDCYIRFVSESNLRTRTSFDSLNTEILYELSSTVNLEFPAMDWTTVEYPEQTLL